MQPKRIKKGHQMADIIENENISAYYSMKYSDEEVLLLDDAKLLAKPNPLRVEMNTLVLCTRGMAQFVMNGSPIQLTEKYAFICPSNTSLSDFLFSPDFEFKAILITNKLLQEFLHDKMLIWTEMFYIRKQNLLAVDEEEISLLGHFYELLDHFLHTTKPRPYKTETIQTLLRSVFLCLCGLLEEKANADVANNHPKRRNSEILFREFMSLLDRTPDKFHPIEWYADQLCITSKHLSAVSKSYSGKTAGEWIKERVVEDIRYYLQSTDLTIKQISTRIGFPNTSFFGKYVKKNMGATPLSIRTKNGCNQLEP